MTDLSYTNKNIYTVSIQHNTALYNSCFSFSSENICTQQVCSCFLLFLMWCAGDRAAPQICFFFVYIELFTCKQLFFFAFLHAFWSVWLIHFGIGFLTFDSLLNSLLCCFEVLGFSVTVLQLLTFDLWQLCLYIELLPTKKNIFRFYSFIYNS